MADQSDVESAIVTAAQAALAAGGANNAFWTTRVYRGWPDSPGLDADLAAWVVNISVSAESRNIAVTTRYPDDWRVSRNVASDMTVEVTGDTAGLGGRAVPGQLIGLLADGFAGVHRTSPGDTIISVAASLASSLASRRAAAKGAAVQVLGVRHFVGRVVADQPAVRETRRQRQVFRVACLCPDPTSRDAVAGIIDAGFSQVRFLSLPDGLVGRLCYVGSSVSDRAQAAALYRRDLLYSVDYATSVVSDLPTLLFGGAAFSANARFVATHLS